MHVEVRLIDSPKLRLLFLGYIHHPHVPERISKTLPEVKLLLIVRDPTERLISDYNQVNGLILAIIPP